mmetsp:Transcript_13592/g.29981  ORF Transcript_13592/g.29981 Transcript_13592/m.29981 type:complete len:257 (-) Transcript_13592:259-1029(-)
MAGMEGSNSCRSTICRTGAGSFVLASLPRRGCWRDGSTSHMQTAPSDRPQQTCRGTCGFQQTHVISRPRTASLHTDTSSSDSMGMSRRSEEWVMLCAGRASTRQEPSPLTTAARPSSVPVVPPCWHCAHTCGLQATCQELPLPLSATPYARAAVAVSTSTSVSATASTSSFAPASTASMSSFAPASIASASSFAPASASALATDAPAPTTACASDCSDAGSAVTAGSGASGASGVSGGTSSPPTSSLSSSSESWER